ncbi:hypothetical protein [Nostoc sp. 106C]|uniref:hypothetical protein n=1 Tax=Nostoc sp. 106C TaxID=1932667 RepID=UPI00106465EE|nr:hypothetical protein [Nostoc sp. 106C]
MKRSKHKSGDRAGRCSRRSTTQDKGVSPNRLVATLVSGLSSTQPETYSYDSSAGSAGQYLLLPR